MVSVIIPTYNREKTLLRSVESVLNQTYQDFEIIVVDDCSKDHTKELIEQIKDSRIKYYCLEKKSGACAARNKGISMAKGEYIAFQDSDDEWLPDKLERQLECLNKQKSDFVFCGFEIVNNKGKVSHYPFHTESHLCSQLELIMESKASTQTIIGRTDAIKNILFDESFPRMQDYDFIIRASSLYNIYYIDAELVKIYIQEDSITASQKEYKKILDIHSLICGKHRDLLYKYPAWHVVELKIMAHSQVMLGDAAAEDTFKEIYNMEHTVTNCIKLLLYRIGLLKLIFRFSEIVTNWRILL